MWGWMGHFWRNTSNESKSPIGTVDFAQKALRMVDRIRYTVLSS
jgi:hypothetical protein